MAIAFCPLCASDELTSSESAEDGREFAVCIAKVHGDDGYIWEPTPRRANSRRGDGLGLELDIWDKLLKCVPAEGTHSYGVVEDRFFERYPADAAAVQERYGHRWRDGKKSANQFSMSSYLAARLSELADEQLLMKTPEIVGSTHPSHPPWRMAKPGCRSPLSLRTRLETSSTSRSGASYRNTIEHV